jgi:2-polyprenyl-3-methyl-5-hydroxy-6-metoxy-1,4-benzoquinol methylase
MVDSARFWDRMAKRYSKMPIPDEAAYEKKLQVTRDYFLPDMEVLEFGCGTGSTAIVHAPYVTHIHAIDVSSKMIEIAQSKADAENICNITFQCSGMDEFNVSDRSFDAVLGLNVVHLIENMDEVFVRVHEMLKPDGVFVTSTPCIGVIMPLLKIIAPLGRFLGLLPVIKDLSVAELESSLTKAGFDIDYRWQPDNKKSVFIVAKKLGCGQTGADEHFREG